MCFCVHPLVHFRSLRCFLFLYNPTIIHPKNLQKKLVSDRLKTRKECGRTIRIIPYHTGDGAVAARRAHNPEVAGASPAPPTKPTVYYRYVTYEHRGIP